jgi:hypothetical protein
MNSVEYNEREWPSGAWNAGGQCLVIEPDRGSGRDWEHSAWFQEWENIAYARLGEEAQLPCS